ncbi:MAG: TraB/GumN family protein [Candidatus Hadarchaeales archaeon]
MIVEQIGERLTLVGTAHVLPQSVRMVREIILEKRPSVVGVELCRGRYLALKEGRVSVPRSPLALILYLIQEFFSRRTGVRAGAEMLEAIGAAEEVGARVEFLDRDIGLTLQRLLALGPWEKLKFAFWAAGGFLFSPRVNPEELLQGKVLSSLLGTFRRACPGFYRVLVEERDEYILNRILELSGTGEKLVCVVGAGHLEGIKRRLAWTFRTEWTVPT